ncbi:hypothetical protein BHM03_00061470, partial [Ensete ventricosum]
CYRLKDNCAISSFYPTTSTLLVSSSSWCPPFAQCAGQLTPPPPLRQKSKFSFPALTTVLRFSCIESYT